MKKNSVRNVVFTGLMAALVFVFTYIRIDIPTPLSNTMLHLGNVMSLLAALLLGGWQGGLAAGIGSMLFDMMDPRYIATSWLTFFMKFAMAGVCGVLCKKSGKLSRQVLSAAAGSCTYVLLYICKTFVTNYWVSGYELETVLTTVVVKGASSFVNGMIAVAGSVLLAQALLPALRRAGVVGRGEGAARD